jgi:hypothetical protein
VGAFIGLALLKFSTSANMSGFMRVRVAAVVLKIRVVLKSFTVNDGLNFILSRFLIVPVGFEDPVVWSVIRCNMTTAAPSRGIRKCAEKNRFRVGCDTEKFPHIQVTILFPIRGIAEKMLVITVAPQNDICPQGRTYPRNAVAMNETMITIPVVHVVFFFIGDLFIIPRIR